MVETVMFFALGFLAATLIALLFIPAINARAERLARRRAEAMFPLSISELTAEKDHLRAEFAVLQRRIERKAEEAFAVKHQSMEELGRRAVRIEMLETEAAERNAVIGELQANLAETATRLAAAEEELAGTKSTLTGLRDTLAAVEDAHRKTLDELTNTRAELDRTGAALAGAKSELVLLQGRFETREAEFADLQSRLSTALGELDTKRITISDLETRLAMQTSRVSEFERTMGERRRELGEERDRLAELAKALLAEQERAAELDRRLKEAERGREGRGAMSGASADEIRAENAELRRLIVEVADDVIQSAEAETVVAQDRRKARG